LPLSANTASARAIAGGTGFTVAANLMVILQDHDFEFGRLGHTHRAENHENSTA
jgi:hypothetical protein